MTSANYCVVVVEATDAKEVSMGALREQMRQALTLRGMAPRTQEAYLAAGHGLAKSYHRGKARNKDEGVLTLSPHTRTAGKPHPS
jgi:hypothetical protein